MKKRIISDAITNISSEYIEKAADYTAAKRSNKPAWLKWGAIAACLLLCICGVFGVIKFLGNRPDIATLNNGDRIVFERSDLVGGALDLAFDVTKRSLTEDEASALFSGLPVTANAVFRNSDSDGGYAQELIGFEGEIGKVKAVISTSNVPLRDTVIVGAEETSKLNGVNIIAGYFVTKPNSRGEQTAIYYASFELGSCKIYLENAGARGDSEATKNQLAKVLQKLIENGEPDLASFIGSQAATGSYGNP